MGRFSRLVDLRRIREEADGLAYAKILGRIESCQQKIGDLEQETKEEHKMACEQVAQGTAPGALMFDDFYRGQKWRIQKLQDKIHIAQREAEAARKVWLAARTQLKQAESMSEKEEAQQEVELRQKNNKELDMIGIVQSRFRP
jgi:flagellar export protein FliJ